MRSLTSSISPRRLFTRVAQLAVGLLVAVAANYLTQRFFPHSGGMLTATAAPILLGRIIDFGKTYAGLVSATRPSQADQPESIPHVLFDTQQYAQAGSATLTFFNSATAANASDPTLSNFANGSLNAGYYFEIHRIFLKIHAVPNTNATTAITGAAQDVELLHKTARGILSWTYKGRPYGGYPIDFFGRPGGPIAGYTAYGSGTAANNVISWGHTEANGGFPVLGNVILAPAQNFTATLAFNSTAISAATNITVAMLGVLHRPLA